MEEQLKLLPIANEINYISDFVARYMRLWNKHSLAIINKNTIEDKVFIEIYNKFKDKLGLLYLISSEKDLTDDMILIDTDTGLLRETRLNYVKLNYTLNVFIDYTPEYIREVAKYFKVKEDQLSPTDYGMSEEVLKVFRQYLSNELDIFTVAPEARRQLIDFLKLRRQNTNKSIMNSYNLKKYNDMLI